MSKQTILVTGANGQLGTQIVNLLKTKLYNVVGFNKEELDIANFEKVNKVVKQINPSVIIHCAAYTKVDLAESEPDHAFLVNGIGTRNMVVASEKQGSKFVYISTDYVFDGNANEPYNEFSITSPTSVYGKSKLAGENFVKHLHSKFFIIRTSWLYGLSGNNFVKTMVQLGRERKEITVVDDQFGCPTNALDLAECIISIIQTEKYGTYHVSNSGYCSWYEFATAIFDELNMNVNLKPCKTKDFPRPAKRPAYSVLDHMSIRLNQVGKMRHWRLALKEFLSSIDEK